MALYSNYPYGAYQNPYLTGGYYYPQAPVYFPNQYSQQPIQIQQPVKPPEQQKNTMAITWIKSEKDVDDEYVGPNSAAAFWNENEPVIYLKKADVTGKTSVTIYDLVERVDTKEKEMVAETKAVDAPSKDEFTHLLGIVTSMSNSMEGLAKEIDSIKGDVYGLAGKKRVGGVKKGEVEEDG